MQDRFKFRCWNKENKRFLHHLSFDLSPKGILILNFAIEGKKYLDVNDTDSYVLMQSTGLKDKNGKLIFEGDILGGIYHGYIEYCTECKCFQLKVKDYGCLACEGDLHWYELVEAEEQNELEVIGNKYENPELLGENQ